MSLRVSAILLCLVASGCMIVQVGVTNPVPGLTTVAVAPFFNQSHERAVDGRRFAFAYFAELQKIPGFRVVPVGVTEQVIIDNDLQMSSPQDALRLAQLLDVDAVVIGSITDYEPYYPPRIGIQVAWYSPYQWTFFPGVQTDPYARRRVEYLHDNYRQPPSEHIVGETQGMNRLRKAARVTGLSRLARKVRDSDLLQKLGDLRERNERLEDTEALRPGPPLDEIQPDDSAEFDPAEKAALPIPAIRSQSPDRESRSRPIQPPDRSADHGDEEWSLIESSSETSRPKASATQHSQAAEPPLPDTTDSAPGRRWPESRRRARSAPGGIAAPPRPIGPPSIGQDASPDIDSHCDPTSYPPAAGAVVHNPLEPLMSYTRIFDGTDADLLAKLRDYVELNGDLRSGGWEAYLHRSEDFIRFASHRMIVEMLTLHGGEGKRRIVFKRRKHK